MLVAILIVAVGCVAFTNGANANFKGVASLYGSGTTSLGSTAKENAVRAPTATSDQATSPGPFSCVIYETCGKTLIPKNRGAIFLAPLQRLSIEIVSKVNLP